MNDMDLQEKVRGNDVRAELDQMIAKLGEIGIGLPLVWLYVWDIISTICKDLDSWDCEFAPGKDINSVWDTLWNKAWGDVNIEGEDVIEWLGANGLLLNGDNYMEGR